MPCRDDCEEVFKNYKNFVCVLVAYVSFWVGFILWAFMGSFWATINIHDVAFTYIGSHRVCDEWKGYTSDNYVVDITGSDVKLNGTNAASASVAGGTVINNSLYEFSKDNGGLEHDKSDISRAHEMMAGFHGYSSNGTSPPPPPSDPWEHCVHTLLYINPGGDNSFNSLMTAWYCFSIMSSAWVIWISLSSLVFCCSAKSGRGRIRIMTLLGISSLCLVIYLVISLICFDYGLYHHAMQFSNENSTGLQEGVTYYYEHSYTIAISIVCQYAIGCIFAWLSVLVAVYNDYTVRRQEQARAARPRWGDVAMIARFGSQTEEYNRYDTTRT